MNKQATAYDLAVDGNFKGIQGSISGGNVTQNIHTKILQVSKRKITNNALTIACPYKGLRSFESRDKELFFGRDHFIITLVEELRKTNLVLLLGASGSGKSSVMRAGLIPWLARKCGTKFTDLTFTPDANPFESFYGSLLCKYSQAEAKIVREAKATNLVRVVKNLRQSNEFWFIFIDQFEEIFTTTDKQKRDEFINGLVQLSRAKLPKVRIVAAMRADFIDKLSPYSELVKDTQQHRPMIVEMQPDELRNAIEQPAAHHGVVFEAGLTDKMIAEIQGQAGYLPLLQYTLDLLWKDEVKTGSINDRILNIDTYQKLGGVKGALQQHVNHIYQNFSPAEQQAVQRIFLKLVGIGENAEVGSNWKPVRRRAQLSEFGEDEKDVLRKLIDRNLLVSDRDIELTSPPKKNLLSFSQEKSKPSQGTVEIAHEILLTSWDKLHHWIKENRRGIALRNRLYEDVKRWQNQNKPEDELWTGSKLEQVLELKKDENFERVLGGFNAEADRFIDASVGVRDRQIQRKLRTTSITSLVLAVFAISAGFQWQDAKKAQQQSNDLLRTVGDVSLKIEEPQPDYEKAIQSIYSEIIDDSNSKKQLLAIAHHNRGISHASIKNDRAAIDDYTQAIGIDPDDARAYYNRGNAHADLENDRAAIDDYTQAIGIDPDHAYAYYNRGNSHFDLENYSAAIDDYTEAIRIDPDYAYTYYYRGNSHLKLKNYHSAIDDYTQAINIDPDYAYAYNNRGLSYAKRKNYHSAIDDYTEAIRIDPDHAKAYNNRGLSHANLKNYLAAVDDYTKAIRINPDYAYAYYNRGNSHRNLKNYPAAVDDYTKAIRIDPDYAKAYYYRGLSHLKLKNYQAAIDDYTQAIGIDPNDGTAYYNRGLSHRNLKNYPAAIKDFTKAAGLHQKQGKTDYYQDALNRIEELQR